MQNKTMYMVLLISEYYLLVKVQIMPIEKEEGAC